MEGYNRRSRNLWNFLLATDGVIPSIDGRVHPCNAPQLAVLPACSGIQDRRSGIGRGHHRLVLLRRFRLRDWSSPSVAADGIGIGRRQQGVGA